VSDAREPLGKLFERLTPDFVGVVDAARERATERDGFLSYAGEFHALGVGALGAALFVVTGSAEVAAMLAAVVYGSGKLASSHLRDARQETAYAALGAAVGTVIGVALRALDLFAGVL